MTDTETESALPPQDPIVEAILGMLALMPPGQELKPETVARALQAARARGGDQPDAWRRFLKPVRQQAIHLARTGRIEIMRKGEVADPENFRGLWRMRLKAEE